jgi:serine/threonine protein kinase/tetratricopeptide (TPR) repeat protein
MEPDRFQLASEVFLEASQMSAADRAALIEVKCGGDGEVRALVEQLLRGHERSFHATRDVGKAASVAAHDAIAGARAGEIVGAYVLVSKLGEGGFGDVWLAERRTPYVQQVAIKIIKPGMDSRAVVARFQQERQSLAIMDHPGIARVMDGGVTSTGRPYFVMDYVKGEPITQYCDRVRLGVRERLALFIRVCEAVQHAHMKGIIHRDIKPSNILVEEIDGTPMPKVIDFGIAKAIDASGVGETLKTEQGIMIGTPEYMSPEQAGGEPDIDTRTDVYSLGVLLYELLVGVPPFDGPELRVKGYEEIRRIIRETEPPRPSTRMLALGASKATGSTTETSRGAMDTRAMSRTLRRELEWIPLKALRKDRSRRYSSPESLAQDVRRYLTGDALEAGPESKAYRAKAFVRRHRGAVAAVGAVGVALVLGIGGTLWMAGRAKQKESIARRQEMIAEGTSRVMRDAFSSVKPELARGSEVTLREVLDKMSQKLTTDTTSPPEVEANVRSVLADAYFSLSDFATARSQAGIAAAKTKEAWGKASPQAIIARANVAIVDVQAGTDVESIKRSAAELLSLRGKPVPDLKEAWTCATTVAALAGDASLSKDLIVHAISLMDEAGEPAQSIERALAIFVGAMLDTNPESSIATMRRAVAMVEPIDPTNPSVLDMRGSLRMRLQSSGHSDEALAMSRETVRRIREINPGPSRLLADEIKEQAAMSRAGGDANVVLTLGREAISIYKACGVTCDINCILSAYDLVGNALNALQRSEEAVEHFTDAIQNTEKCPEQSYAALYYFFYNRSVALSRLGRFAEAIKDVEQAQAKVAALMKREQEGAKQLCEKALERYRSGEAN